MSRVAKQPITLPKGVDLTVGKDLVFHEAAIRITQCAEDPRLALEVLVDGTFNVVEAAAELGVSKLIAASSASVYGLAEEFPTTERHHHHNNDTFYGARRRLPAHPPPTSKRCLPPFRPGRKS